MAKKKWDGVSVCRNCKHPSCNMDRAAKKLREKQVRFESWMQRRYQAYLKRFGFVPGQELMPIVKILTYEEWRAQNAKAG
jgi:hypothetical protein